MMEITMGIVSLFLKRQYHITSIHLTERDDPIQGFRVWDGEDPQRDVLYIVENERLRGFTRKKGRLCIGIQYSQDAARHSCQQISVDEPLGLYPLINALQGIFQEFYSWQMRMERLFYTHAGFKEIFNEIEMTFGLVSLLVDKNLQYVEASDSYGLYNDWLGDGRSMPLDMLDDMMSDEDFRTAIQHDRAFCYENVYTKVYVYCYNIKIKGAYEARLLIQDKTGGPFPGGLTLAGYVGENIAKMFAWQERERGQERILYDFYDIMKDLLLGIPKDAEEICQRLAVRGWKKEQLYQVFQFQFMGEENATVTRRYYQTKIEDLFRDCCVLPDEKRLCCIWNLSAMGQEEDAIHQELSVFLRDNLCRVGISQRFGDIALLHAHYLEAQYALELGLRSKSTSWYYPFASMVLPFILSQATRELGPEQLSHPGIRRLMEYDRKEHTELVATVREYIKHCYNVTRTAEALFIHRTTLLFRLQRIKKLTGIDWEDWKERLWIGVTLELLDYTGAPFS